MNDDDTVKLVFDTKLKRPACVILQAIYGGDSGAVSEHFPPDTWLITPTPDMTRFRIPRSRLPEIAERVIQEVRNG
jgi:hypothetical protein